MSLRNDNKRAERWRRSARRVLVHAAGCIHPECKWDLNLVANETPMRSVNVPRSLRGELGPRVGGRN